MLGFLGLDLVYPFNIPPLTDLSSVAAAGSNAEEDPDEGARDLSEMAIRLLDKDMDGRVSMSDFLASVNEDSLLMEILGPCLPSAARAAAILSALNNNLSKSHYYNYSAS